MFWARYSILTQEIAADLNQQPMQVKSLSSMIEKMMVGYVIPLSLRSGRSIETAHYLKIPTALVGIDWSGIYDAVVMHGDHAPR